MTIPDSTQTLLAELGYSFVIKSETPFVGEIRNAANDTIVSLDPLQVRPWINGVRHGLSNLTSCIHEATAASDGKAHAAHKSEVASCPWCIIRRKDRELEALRKTIARLEQPKGKKRG